MKLTSAQLRLIIREEVEGSLVLEMTSCNEGLDEDMESSATRWAVTKGIPKVAKSLGLAIPGLDIILGSVLAAVSLAEIKGASDRLIRTLDVDEETIAKALLDNDPEDRQWHAIMAKISVANTDDLKRDFDKFLAEIKSLFITILQTADTAITAAPAAGVAATGVGIPAALAGEVGVNIATAGIGLAAELSNPEQWVLDMGSRGAAAYEKIFNWLIEQGPEFMKKMDGGGAVLKSIIIGPARSFRRLGEFYRALHHPDEATPAELVATGAMEKARSELISQSLATTAESYSPTAGRITKMKINKTRLRRIIREELAHRPVPASLNELKAWDAIKSLGAGGLENIKEGIASRILVRLGVNVDSVVATVFINFIGNLTMKDIMAMVKGDNRCITASSELTEALTETILEASVTKIPEALGINPNGMFAGALREALVKTITEDFSDALAEALCDIDYGPIIEELPGGGIINRLLGEE